MAFDYEKYIRTNKMPHIWCAGCGHGIIMKGLIRAMDKAQMDLKNTVIVSGIGCASRLPGYIDCCTLHTTHGRALPFATGVKMANMDLNVIVVSGDGDSTAIGGNHFIHSCRRNINITMVVFNNFNYGMTGGQYSPTTPTNTFASTTPHGNIDLPFDITNLARGAGASYVARTTVYHVSQMDKFIYQGFQNKGFSVIEIVENCYTNYGRRNKKIYKDNNQMIELIRKAAVNVKAAQKMSAEELEGRFTIGVLHHQERQEYTQAYRDLAARLTK